MILCQRVKIKFSGRIFLGHQGPTTSGYPRPRPQDVPDKSFMQGALFCCSRQGIAGMSRDLGRDSGVTLANQTKERPVHELFPGAFRNKSSMWIALVFPRKNTRIHKDSRNSWSFCFGPLFGLVCRGDSGETSRDQKNFMQENFGLIFATEINSKRAKW